MCAASNVGAFSGPRRPTASSPSRRRRWATCSQASTGAILSRPGARRRSGKHCACVLWGMCFPLRVTSPAKPPLPPPLPTDLAAAHAMILAERAKRIEAQAAALTARAEASSVEATIAHLTLMIEKLRRALYGQRSERTARLIDQMELQLEELETQAMQDEVAASPPHTPSPPMRRRPVRKPSPAHLPRERVVVPAPTACPCCGSSRLSKLGEDVTET